MSNSSSDNQTLLAIFQTAATMRIRGLSDKSIRKRLMETGLNADAAAGVIEGVPEFLQKTGGKGRIAGPEKIFISHSHHDRDDAAYLQKILGENDIQTFLDQHQIVPGQELKERLMLGLVWCDKLLLLWSGHADQSEFVQWEWRLAKRLMKDIVPYSLDGTEPPEELAGLVYVDQSDRQHGHAGLLRAVRGRHWKPEPHTPFPGMWIAELNLMGLGEARYELELRANGQVIGNGQIGQSGLMGGLAQSLDVSNILGMSIPINGTWSYDDREKMLRLDITATLMGQTNRDVVNIRATGNEQGWLQGQTLGGLPWRFRRVR